MADRSLQHAADADLATALRGLANTLDWPAARPAAGGPDVATRVRARIVATPPVAARRRVSWWPARRAFVLAIVALFALATVAAAVAFGVPGIRLLFGEPPGSAPATVAPGGSPLVPSGPPGSWLDLGDQVALDELDGQAPFPVRLPADPAVGNPAAAYVTTRGEVTLVWAPSDELPATADPGIGLLLMEFRGTIEPGGVNKIIGSGARVETVRVDGELAYWITGDPHFYFYETPEGEMVEDSRRWVGDALIWADDGLTYRLETSLGRNAALRIAETLE